MTFATPPHCRPAGTVCVCVCVFVCVCLCVCVCLYSGVVFICLSAFGEQYKGAVYLVCESITGVDGGDDLDDDGIGEGRDVDVDDGGDGDDDGEDRDDDDDGGDDDDDETSNKNKKTLWEWGIIPCNCGRFFVPSKFFFLRLQL